MPEKPTPTNRANLDPNASPAETATSLVNETSAERPPSEIIKELQAQRDSYKRGQERYQERLREAEMKLARNHSSPQAMRFRIFLELVNGMASSGILSPETLARKPGSEKGILKHAAGLSEIAYAELQLKPLFGLKGPQPEEQEEKE